MVRGKGSLGAMAEGADRYSQDVFAPKKMVRKDRREGPVGPPADTLHQLTGGCALGWVQRRSVDLSCMTTTSLFGCRSREHVHDVIIMKRRELSFGVGATQPHEQLAGDRALILDLVLSTRSRVRARGVRRDSPAVSSADEAFGAGAIILSGG